MTARGIGISGESRSRSALVEGRAAYVPVMAAAVASSALILFVARHLTFWQDEWTFLIDPARGLLEPTNEHWSTGLYLTFDAILAVFGGRSYLPFMVVLVLWHLAAATALFVLVRARAGLGIATGAATMLLFLGSASEDLLWAWQIGFIAATALGLWAFAAFEADRPLLAATLLIGALATSGIGLPFLAGALVAYRRRWLLLPIGVYGAWYVAFGTHGFGQLGHPFSLDTFIQLPVFVALGVFNAAGSIIGIQLGPLAGGPIVAYLAVTAPRTRLVAACAISALAEYSMIGIVRIGEWSGDVWAVSRYVYPAAAMLLVVLALSLPKIRRPTLRLALAAFAALALVLNITALVRGPGWGRYRMDAVYGCLPAELPGPSVALARVVPFDVPPAFRC